MKIGENWRTKNSFKEPEGPIVVTIQDFNDTAVWFSPKGFEDVTWHVFYKDIFLEMFERVYEKG